MPSFATYPSLKNRTVLITGGATGIGAALVTQFCAQGCRVAFIDIHETAAHELITNIQSLYNNAPIFFACNLRDISALKHAIQQIIAKIGNIQVLINNAANDERHNTLEIDEQKWQEIMANNLHHQFFAAQAVLPGMIALGSGAIINISSNCFLLEQIPNYPGYTTAKAGIIGLTRALATEFGQYNIRVNCILPGWVMTQKQLDHWLTPAAETTLMQSQALKQKIYPDDIARAALFLAADDSHMFTKQTLVIDGGRI